MASGSITDFERCNLCRRSFPKGKKHRYSATHIQTVRRILSKFSTKIEGAFSAVASPQVHEDAVGDRILSTFWCCFCSEEVQLHFVFDGRLYLAYAGLLDHIASAGHKKMVHSFWRANRIRTCSSDASSSSDLTENPVADCQKVSNSIMQEYRTDIKRRYRNGTVPEEWKEWLELQKTGLKKVSVKSDSTAVLSPHADESLPSHASKLPVSTSLYASSFDWRMESFVMSSEQFLRFCDNAKKCIEEYFAEKDQKLNKEAHQMQIADEKRHRFMEFVRSLKMNSSASFASSHQPKKTEASSSLVKPGSVRMRTIAAHGAGLTRVKRPKMDEGEGNVHSGAPPPWLQNATEAEAAVKSSDVIGPTEDDFHRHLVQEKKSKLPSTRVGAKFDRRGLSADDWLPSFGRVWSKNCRTHQNRFMKDRSRKPAAATHSSAEHGAIEKGNTEPDRRVVPCGVAAAPQSLLPSNNGLQPVSESGGMRACRQYQRKRKVQDTMSESTDTVARLGIASNLL